MMRMKKELIMKMMMKKYKKQNKKVARITIMKVKKTRHDT